MNCSLFQTYYQLCRYEGIDTFLQTIAKQGNKGKDGTRYGIEVFHSHRISKIKLSVARLIHKLFFG